MGHDVTVQHFTRTAQPACRIDVKKRLIYGILARKTTAVCTALKPVQRTAQLIDPGVALECEQRIQLTIGHLILHDLIGGDLKSICILQMCIQALQDTPSHHTLAFLHDGSSLSRTDITASTAYS
jgi:hypothetical protein